MRTIRYIYAIPLAVILTFLFCISCLLYESLPKAIKKEYNKDIADVLSKIAKDMRSDAFKLQKVK